MYFQFQHGMKQSAVCFAYACNMRKILLTCREGLNTYAYAFLNLETRKAYAVMFKKMFLMLGNVAREPVTFQHIHGTENGIRAITVDMCKKQAPGKFMQSICAGPANCILGFGDFLHELDPSREWAEHLTHVLIFCKTHVQRNFQKKFGNHPAKHIIHLIWEAETKDAIISGLDQLCSIHPELTSWVKGKKKGWIMSGLTVEQSKIPVEWWKYIQDHTGISESSHFQDNNFTGRKLSLLTAVLK